jgi:hypothetical protein
MFRFMITLASCIRMGTYHGEGDIPKMRSWTEKFAKFEHYQFSVQEF